ncbi:hypothetical protein PhaeoP97_03660 (plasmid) [Phaeobacter porticola]|uniref:Uncharacterized protein n=1 Tax=Phaeobacter porticola TaxID=1844006 RepID=A0A1L3I9Z5_9RHOB|nr:hypothetical protein PhaeoP97_03658 [Phaeobacter porticola]APG49011.1 hypothetical protein PhaeoP97_03660 [Phaeobacter porticola]
MSIQMLFCGLTHVDTMTQRKFLDNTERQRAVF